MLSINIILYSTWIPAIIHNFNRIILQDVFAQHIIYLVHGFGGLIFYTRCHTQTHLRNIRVKY